MNSTEEMSIRIVERFDDNTFKEFVTTPIVYVDPEVCIEIRGENGSKIIRTPWSKETMDMVTKMGQLFAFFDKNNGDPYIVFFPISFMKYIKGTFPNFDKFVPIRPNSNYYAGFKS